MAEKPITQYTDDELRRSAAQASHAVMEIQREQRRRQLEARRTRAAEIEKLIPALVQIVLRHEKPGCSDESSFNAFAGGCTRCTILEVQSGMAWDPHYNLELESRLVAHTD